ncbi:hypothetical protein [Kineococcus radiotolerans]|uniref:Uncharacterized protein n=1 Tax=Kineococcus radiotolerans (strain ATCC BAA-149 / DSM 14245 / SRS30216) TaxID=266940 RepID=A6W8V1_KINRD|nr:hypothetical protein [Kineococcus radiotolerans]ABS03240.1 hypothetical protein Krad_1754 [Kineococcus radiotolerans SRS30216 = ATCC BAA-149]
MTGRRDRIPGDTLIGPFVIWTMRAKRHGRPIGALRQNGRVVGAGIRIGPRLVCVALKSTIPAYRKRTS